MRTRLLTTVLLLVVLIAYGYMQPPWGYNQATRLDVLHAVFTEGRISIDSFHENTGDKIEWNGHYYSDKAPGTALLAAPAFGVISAALHMFSVDVNTGIGWKVSEWFTTVFSVGLLAAISAVFLYDLLRRYTSSRTALTTVLSIYLGTMVYTYGVMLFSHTATIALMISALCAIDTSVGLLKENNGSSYNAAFAGLCLGFAIAGEYTSALACIAIGIFVLTKNARHAMFLCIGSVIPLALIPLNNWMISGTLLSLPYEHVTDFPGMKEGFFGIQFTPSLKNMWLLTGSQYRGLFFWSPFFLLVFPGFIDLWRSSRRVFWMSTTVPIAYLILISSYSYWHGGWALGPRHLASAVPFLVLPAALGCRMYRKLGVILGVLSVTLTGTGTLLQPMAPEGNLYPLTDLYWPMLLKGEVRENFGSVLGLQGNISLLPLLCAVCVLAAVCYRIIGTKTEVQ